MPPKIVLLCHVEPGTVHRHTILPGFTQTEGIVRARPTILEFADRRQLPLGLALTPQALTLVDVDLGGLDAGLHLHPIDPILGERVRGRLVPDRDCLGRYSAEEQAVLIDAGRRVFEERLGRSPRLFVAGRWSEDAATGALLRREGFTHDGSVLPGHRSPCADWSRVPRLAQPYAPAKGDVQSRGSEPYVYLPVYQGLWGHHLTPETLLDLGASYFKAALQEAKVGGADAVHIYFHSPLGLDPRAMEAFGEVLAYAHDVLHLDAVPPTAVTASLRPRSRSFPMAYWARMNWTLVKSFGGRGELGRKLAGVESVSRDWDGVSPGGGEKPPPSAPE